MIFHTNMSAMPNNHHFLFLVMVGYSVSQHASVVRQGNTPSPVHQKANTHREALTFQASRQQHSQHEMQRNNTKNIEMYGIKEKDLRLSDLMSCLLELCIINKRVQ